MSRISFEIEPALHRAVRVAAAAKGMTVRQFMLETIEERLRQEANGRDTDELFGIAGPALQRDWDNEWDAVYDKLG